MEESAETTDIIEWHYDVPLLTSRFMVWDFVRVTLLSTAISYVLVAFTGGLVDGEPVAASVRTPDRHRCRAGAVLPGQPAFG